MTITIRRKILPKVPLSEQSRKLKSKIEDKRLETSLLNELKLQEGGATEVDRAFQSLPENERNG